MNEWTKKRQKAARDLGPEYNMVFGADVGDMLAEIDRCWGEIERLTTAIEDLRPSEDEPPTPAERVTDAELATARKLISALVSVDDAARHLSEEAEISGSPTSPTAAVAYPYWLDLQTALDTINRGKGHDAPPGAPALTMFDRLAAEVRALRTDLEGRCTQLDMSNAEIERLGAVLQAERAAWCKASGAESASHLTALLAARPAPAAAPHGDDPCAACTAILGSPLPCAMTHDMGPGAYPADASLEARAVNAEATFRAASGTNTASAAVLRAAWIDVVHAVDASRPPQPLTPREQDELDRLLLNDEGCAKIRRGTEEARAAIIAAVRSLPENRPGLTEDAQRLKLATDLRTIAAWHEGQANKDATTWAWHTGAASKCYAAAIRFEHGAAPKRPGLTEEEARLWALQQIPVKVRVLNAQYARQLMEGTLLALSRGDIPADVRAGTEESS